MILGELRISLPTDQIVRADAANGYASVSFGGMSFNGAVRGRLVFTRVRELHPEHELSPDRSHTMLLDPEWVATVAVNDKRVWPEVVYKIVPAALWQASEASGFFAGSPVDQQDGFIHFSTAPQVRATPRNTSPARATFCWPRHRLARWISSGKRRAAAIAFRTSTDQSHEAPCDGCVNYRLEQTGIMCSPLSNNVQDRTAQTSQRVVPLLDWL